MYQRIPSPWDGLVPSLAEKEEAEKRQQANNQSQRKQQQMRKINQKKRETKQNHRNQKSSTSDGDRRAPFFSLFSCYPEINLTRSPATKVPKVSDYPDTSRPRQHRLPKPQVPPREGGSWSLCLRRRGRPDRTLTCQRAKAFLISK